MCGFLQVIFIMSVTVTVQFAATKLRRQLLESRQVNAACFADVCGVLILYHPARLP